MNQPIKVSEELLSKAQDAFWDVICKAHPEVMWGDFGPDETLKFDKDCEDAANGWLFNNHPVNNAFNLSEDGEKAGYTEVVVCFDHGVFTPVNNHKDKEIRMAQLRNEFPESIEIKAISMKRAREYFPLLEKYFTDDGEYKAE